jgi:hypothetical protein
MFMSHCDLNFFTHACTTPSMHDLNKARERSTLQARHMHMHKERQVRRKGQKWQEKAGPQGHYMTLEEAVRYERDCRALGLLHQLPAEHTHEQGL